MTDPIGLSFENYDGIGRWRTTENGVHINASGVLDDISFSDSWDLSLVLASHDDVAPCLIETMYQYGTNHIIDTGEMDLVSWHAEGFSQAEYRILNAIRDIAISPAFQGVGAY